MLKIYKAFCQNGIVVLKDYIEFEYGMYDTGEKGFGIIDGGDILSQKEKIAYEKTQLNTFERYLNDLSVENGYVNNFRLLNAKKYYDVFKESKYVVKSNEFFERNNLNEEAVILFTDNVLLKKNDFNGIKKYFGRVDGNAMYIIRPNSQFILSPEFTDSEHFKCEYELLQSNRIGKRLILSKMNRKI